MDPAPTGDAEWPSGHSRLASALSKETDRASQQLPWEVPWADGPLCGLGSSLWLRRGGMRKGGLEGLEAELKSAGFVTPCQD